MEHFTEQNKNAIDIRKGIRLPELLCPAGSYKALEAAIDGGADAIYMGGVAFNARINAKNFTAEEMKRGIDLAHAYGAKVYIAANTLIYDRELDDFLRAAESAYMSGADALIVADIGAARAVHERIPIELHASTQVSGHNADASLLLRDAGFSRMVCAREMSREDIKHFIDTSPLEAEVFVHGALCVCHSGQCLFSSRVGGRSGNRGECAQPCRLPYRGRAGKTEYPLSLKDLSLAAHIPELCDLGISSLKIEGRMKSPEYVRDVTRIWRRLLDGRRGASPEDMKELEAVFSRGGFTDGYYTSRIGKGMLGVRSEEQKRVTRELEPFEGIKRKIPVEMSISVKIDIPVSLTVRRLDSGKAVTVTGECPFAARTAPIDEETVRRSLMKLGGTPFEAEKITIELDSGLMLPVSVLNAIRRKGTEALISEEGKGEKTVSVSATISIKPAKRRTRARAAIFYDPTAIPKSAYGFFDIIYTPLEKYTGSTNGVALPPIIFDSERPTVERLLAEAKQKGAEHVLVGNLGHIALARDSGLVLHGDLRLNVCNNATAASAENMGLEDVILSPELTLAQLRDVGGKSLAVVYGRAPLMVTEKCVSREIADCKTCESGKVVLTDRKGIRFPVLKVFSHRSLIVNSVPLYMVDKQDVLDKNGITMQYFIFTVETADEAARVITAYKKRTPPADSARVKRIK
ncbi:MAG: U32 family peptidase [Clostridia bacterium]|nr:U32 family peptidase [Clostridia bacterium]